MDTRARSVTGDYSARIQFDVRALHAQARERFSQVGIDIGHLDRSVLECLIAAGNRSIENPLGYCLAVGRRLQNETEPRAGRMRRAQRQWIENACRHGVLEVGECPKCAEDRQRALELFPSLRKFLNDRTNSADITRGRQ